MIRLFSSTPAYRHITTVRSRIFDYKVLIKLLQLVVIIAVTGALSFFILFRIDTDLRINVRQWSASTEVVVTESLTNAGSCYAGDLAPIYQQGSKTQQIKYIPGFRLQDDTCFGYAATISEPIQAVAVNITTATLSSNTANLTKPIGSTYFHTHWSSDNNRQMFGETQLTTVRSFVATQRNPATTLIVWIYEQDELALTQSAAWQTVRKHIGRVKYEIIADEPVSFGALAKYGGLWFDINTFFVRDLSPLLGGNDWMSQATCFTSVNGNPFLGSSMMYFHKHSPHLCELKAAATAAGVGGALQDAKTGWLYYRVYQRLLRNGYKPWSILPWCYVDPSQCKKPNRLQDPFDSSTSFDRRMVDSIFAYRYHSNPPSNPSGAIYTYLHDKYFDKLHW